MCHPDGPGCGPGVPLNEWLGYDYHGLPQLGHLPVSLDKTPKSEPQCLQERLRPDGSAVSLGTRTAPHTLQVAEPDST